MNKRGVLLVVILLVLVFSLNTAYSETYSIYFNSSDDMAGAGTTESEKLFLSVEGAGEWLILFSAEINQSRASEQAFVYFKNSTDYLNSFIFQMDDITWSDTWRAVSSFYITNITSSENFSISFKSSSNDFVAGLRKARINAIRLDIPDSDYSYNQSGDEYTLQASGWSEKLSTNEMNVVLDGTYLILASGETTSGTGNTFDARVNISNNLIPEFHQNVYYSERTRGGTGVNYASMMIMGLVNLSSGWYNVSLEGDTSGTLSNFRIRQARLAVLKLDAYNYYFSQNITGETTTSTSYLNRDELQFTSENKKYIILAGMFGRPEKPGSDRKASFIWEADSGGGYITEQDAYIHSIVDTNDYFSSYSSKGYSFSGENINLRTKWKSDTSGKPAYSKNSLILALTYPTYDSIPPNITIASPANQTYNNNSILVHITYEEGSIDTIFWDNGTDNTTYEYWLSPNFYDFPEGSSTILVYANDSAGNLNNTESVTFFVDITSPSVNIVLPGDGASFGAANNLALNFTTDDSGIGLDSCWYNINNTDNVSITGCENTTFNVAGSGSYVIELFANDSLNNLGIVSSSFSVAIGAPSISLISPVNVVLNYTSITFIYTPSDADLDTCELWGNFSEEFILNQSDADVVSDAENYFYLDLIDGNYTWNIRCNDSSSNFADNGNKSFIIDTINPGLVLSEPSGSKSSRTVSASWSVSDENTADCVYNVYRGESLEVPNTTIDCSLGSTSFAVTVDADFIFNFYVNDSAGNTNSSSSSFSVSTGGGPGPGPAGGGGGGGSSYIPPETNKTIFGLEMSSLGDIVIKPGESKILSLNVKNSGNTYLNKCKLVGGGEASSWISAESEQGLAAGQSTDFIFSVSVPDNVEAKDYGASVFIRCDEKSASHDFVISVLSSRLKLSIKEIKQNGKKLDFSYLVENGGEENSNIEINYWIVDELNNKEAEGIDSFGLSSGEQADKQGSLDLTGLVAGTYTLVIKSNSEKESASVQEQILIGNIGLIGGAIFGQEGGRIFSIIFIIGLGLLVAFFVVKRIIKNVGKQDRTDFVRHKLRRK